MKRTLCALLAAALCALFCLPAAGMEDPKTYTLETPGITLACPGDYVVCTRENLRDSNTRRS